MEIESHERLVADGVSDRRDLSDDAVGPGGCRQRAELVREVGLERPIASVAVLDGRLGEFFGAVTAQILVNEHPVADVPTEELVYRDIVVASLDVPERLVDAGEGAHQHGAAAKIGALIQLPPVILGSERVLVQEMSLHELRNGCADGLQSSLNDRLAPADYPHVRLQFEQQPPGRNGEHLVVDHLHDCCMWISPLQATGSRHHRRRVDWVVRRLSPTASHRFITKDFEYQRVHMSVLERLSLEGETAIVTGAARGLGKQMATGLTEMGADVAIADVDVEEAERTAAELGDETKVIATEVDVTDEASVEEMVEDVTDRLGPVDVLVNNAGIVENAPAEETTLDSWRRVLAVNLDGVFLCAKHVGRRMLERGEGRIINIASMSGIDVNVPQKQASYNTTKAGVSMLTKSLAVEWADRGVRVNAIAPGYMRTDLVDEVLEANPEMEEAWLENTPMGRLGRPEELRELVVYLASDASSYMTGSTVVMDGGYTSR